MIETNLENEDQTQSARRELYEVYADPTARPRRKRKLIESLDEIYGYDLAFLVGLIMHTEFSGNLNIISQTNEISGITFSKGQITKIDLNDKETIMGELIIKEGLIEREQLHQLLQQQSNPLGELLIQNNIATKEQIVAILVKQMRLRLSKYINNVKYRLNFAEADVMDYGLSISYQEYLVLAHDWVAGRFSPEWLKLHYMELNEGIIEHTQDGTHYTSLEALPLTTDLTNFLGANPDEKVFSKVFNAIKSEKDREYFLKCFHYGIMSGQIVLKHDPTSLANTDTVLKNIYVACNKKSGVELVETLAHILKFKPTEIDSIFQAINNYVLTYSGEDDEMKNNMFRIALEMLAKKHYYQEEVSRKYSAASATSFSSQDSINKKISEIYTDLLEKKLYEAIDKLKKLNQYSSSTPKLKLYMVWAKALMSHQNNIKINLTELERDFFQILPEDKDTAEYYYVKSILHALKKEEAQSTSYFQQAVRLNPELKQYPPIKQTESFIKKLFKFSIVALIFTLGAKVQAQGLSLEDETTPAKAKLTLPFVYLNQYFNYKVSNDGVVQINETNYDLNDMQFERNANKYDVTLSGTFERFAKDPKFYEFSSKTQKLKLAKHSLIENKYTFESDSVVDYDYICLMQTNQFTNLQFCKSIAPSNESGLASMTFNGEAIDSPGNIVLTDSSTKATFKVTKKNQDFLMVQTVKRNILPLKIDKTANSEDFNIQFIDAGRSRFAWEEKINMNQNSFNLKFDELLTLKQGIFFKNTVTADQTISQLVIDKDKMQKKYYNKLIISPLIVFEELSGKSRTVDAMLRSDIGYGFSASVDTYLENQQNIFAAAAFYTMKLTPTNNNTTVENGRTYVMSTFAGYKYSFNEDWALAGILRFDENLFFYQTSATSIALTKTFTKMIGLVPEYTFYTKNGWTVSGDAGLNLILPTNVPNSTTTGTGTYFTGNLKATYKVNWGRLTAGASLGSRAQKNDTYSYVGSTLIYRVGLNYLF